MDARHAATHSALAGDERVILFEKRLDASVLLTACERTLGGADDAVGGIARMTAPGAFTTTHGNVAGAGTSSERAPSKSSAITALGTTTRS